MNLENDPLYNLLLHGHYRSLCYLREPIEAQMTAWADLLIFAAYLTIATLLASCSLAWKGRFLGMTRTVQKVLERHGQEFMTGAAVFVAMCSVSHLSRGLAETYGGLLWYVASIAAILTAMVSWAFALALIGWLIEASRTRTNQV